MRQFQACKTGVTGLLKIADYKIQQVANRFIELYLGLVYQQHRTILPPALVVGTTNQPKNSLLDFDDGLVLMAAPKNRGTKHRKRLRNSKKHGRNIQGIQTCEKCGSYKLLHYFCRGCWVNALELTGRKERGPARKKDSDTIGECTSAKGRHHVNGVKEVIFNMAVETFKLTPVEEVKEKDIPLHLRRPGVPEKVAINTKVPEKVAVNTRRRKLNSYNKSLQFVHQWKLKWYRSGKKALPKDLKRKVYPTHRVHRKPVKKEEVSVKNVEANSGSSDCSSNSNNKNSSSSTGSEN